MEALSYGVGDCSSPVWATRYLTITFRSGMMIDSWKYTALSGRFYEFGGIHTEPLDEDTVYAINGILGIE